MIGNFAVQFFRWRFLLRQVYPNIPALLVLKSILFGVTLGLVTPGNIGELGRGLYFKNYDRWLVTGLTMIDKFSGIVVISFLGLLSISQLISTKFSLSSDMIIIFNIIIGIILIFIAILALNSHWIYRFTEKIPGNSQFKQKVVHLASSLSYLNSKSVMILLAFSTFWTLIIALQYYFLISAFTDIVFINHMIAVCAMLFTKILLPISLADLGIREGIAIFYFSLFGTLKTAVFNASVLIFFLNILMPALIGSFFLFRLHLFNQVEAKPASEKMNFTESE
jgi:uncharacterized membrane protein YbhN (UPF0104 family)